MWSSETSQFNLTEMNILWSTPALMLAEMIASSTPVVALRSLAEVMLNGDIEKLTTLLVDPNVNATWQAWQMDSGLDARDVWYATQLTEYLARMSDRRIGTVEAKLPDLPVVHVPLEDLNYPNYMDADETSLWVSQHLEPGTRIVLRCDQVVRPYLPSDSYYEPGTVTSCSDGTNGRYLIDFRHDPWPPRIYLESNVYVGIRHKGVTEFETQYHEVLESGAPVILFYNLSGLPFYIWGEVVSCRQVNDRHHSCQVRVVPGQV